MVRHILIKNGKEMFTVVASLENYKALQLNDHRMVCRLNQIMRLVHRDGDRLIKEPCACLNTGTATVTYSYILCF